MALVSARGLWDLARLTRPTGRGHRGILVVRRLERSDIIVSARVAVPSDRRAGGRSVTRYPPPHRPGQKAPSRVGPCDWPQFSAEPSRLGVCFFTSDYRNASAAELQTVRGPGRVPCRRGASAGVPPSPLRPRRRRPGPRRRERTVHAAGPAPKPHQRHYPVLHTPRGDISGMGTVAVPPRGCDPSNDESHSVRD